MDGEKQGLLQAGLTSPSYYIPGQSSEEFKGSKFKPGLLISGHTGILIKLEGQNYLTVGSVGSQLLDFWYACLH